RIYDKEAERLPANSLASEPAAEATEPAIPSPTASSEPARPEVDSAPAPEEKVEPVVRAKQDVAASVEDQAIAEPARKVKAIEPEPTAQPKSPAVAVPRVQHQPEAPATPRPKSAQH